MTEYVVNHAVVSVWDPDVELKEAKANRRVKRFRKNDVVTEDDLKHADIERLTSGNPPALKEKTDEADAAEPVAGMLTGVANLSPDARNALREQLAEFEDEDEDLLGTDDEQKEFDPSKYSVDEVNSYLDDADEDEVARVLEAERSASKPRVGITEGPHAG